jgi:hypothetical protein
MRTLTRIFAVVAGLYVLGGTASAQYYAGTGSSDYARSGRPVRGSTYAYYSPVQNFYAGGAPVAVVRPAAYPLHGTPAFGYPGLGYPGRAPRATLFK